MSPQQNQRPPLKGGLANSNRERYEAIVKLYSGTFVSIGTTHCGYHTKLHKTVLLKEVAQKSLKIGACNRSYIVLFENFGNNFPGWGKPALIPILHIMCVKIGHAPLGQALKLSVFYEIDPRSFVAVMELPCHLRLIWFLRDIISVLMWFHREKGVSGWFSSSHRIKAAGAADCSPKKTLRLSTHVYQNSLRNKESYYRYCILLE